MNAPVDPKHDFKLPLLVAAAASAGLWALIFAAIHFFD